jgi:hypothetical protein
VHFLDRHPAHVQHAQAPHFFSCDSRRIAELGGDGLSHVVARARQDQRELRGLAARGQPPRAHQPDDTRCHMAQQLLRGGPAADIAHCAQLRAIQFHHAGGQPLALQAREQRVAFQGQAAAVVEAGVGVGEARDFRHGM